MLAAQGKFQGKTVVVTGAGKERGIGYAIARRFAAEGANLVLSDIARLEGDLRERAASLRAQNSPVLAVTCDVTAAGDVERLFAAAVEQFGGIDILVNNAGVFLARLVLNMTEAEWDLTCDVIGKGTFLCSQAAVRAMVQRGRGGRIINISSVRGKSGDRYEGAYAFAKAGVIGFTQALAREVAQYGILVNAVCPGVVKTDLTDEFRRDLVNRYPEQVTSGTVIGGQEIPLARYGSPDEVAALVSFLASSDADYITGQSINVDGGMVTH